MVNLKRVRTQADAAFTFWLRELHFVENTYMMIGYCSNRPYTVLGQGLETEITENNMNILQLFFNQAGTTEFAADLRFRKAIRPVRGPEREKLYFSVKHQ